MVIAKLYGGLGNQLFQYATARSISHRVNSELVLDIHWYDEVHSNASPRFYELGNFNISARVTNSYEAKKISWHYSRFLKFVPIFKPWRYLREKHYQFDREIVQLSGDLYLDGYWQSPKYFENIRSLLLEELKVKQALPEKDENIINEMRAANSVAVHVRRGDYLSAKAIAVHGLCGLDYYNAAIDLINERVNKPHYFIFSDDMEWVKAHLLIDGPCRYIDHNVGKDSYKDMVLMSHCRHHIIANSSFSWWGAWLSDYSDKVVIAPKRWFQVNYDTSHLIPEGWVRI